MVDRFSNAAQTQLNGAIDNSVTSITIDSATGFPETAPFRILVEAEGANSNEIMTVTAGAGTTSWTVTRASEAYAGVQSASSHADNAVIKHVFTAGSIHSIIGTYVDYESMILAESALIHYWPMDDAAGTTVADAKASGGAWDGTHSESSAPARSLVRGGTNSRPIAGNRITYGTSRHTPVPWTYECWIIGQWVNSSPIGYWSGTTGAMIYVGSHPASTIRSAARYFLYSNGTSIGPALASYEGDPTHIVGTHDGTTGRLYINGQLIVSGALPSTTTNALPLETGNYNNGTAGNLSNGLIQHLAIYNDDLSAQTILDHYNAGRIYLPIY
jgi:hypothetical protein